MSKQVNTLPLGMYKVESLLRGEYVKLKEDSKEVFATAGYDRGLKRYILESTNDINKYRYVKKGTLLHCGFTY